MAYTPGGPPPPTYRQSQRLSLLSLDGGGTRTYVQVQLLCEIMHRLAWDKGLISSRPSVPQKCQVYPADCFDYIGAGGCGAVIAFLLAAGHTAESSLTEFHTLAPLLSSTRIHASPSYPGESLTELALALDACLPRHEVMYYKDDWIVDLPTRTNVWIAGPPESTTNQENEKTSHPTRDGNGNGRGTLVLKGSPIRQILLPLVLAEIEREMRGDQVSLDHTLEFLQAVCPVFQDCDLLLALGSGDVPLPLATGGVRSSGKEKGGMDLSPSPIPPPAPSWLASTIAYLLTWFRYTRCTTPSSNLPTPSPQPPAPLARSSHTREQSRALNAYIPTHTYGRSYIRLSPDLTTRVYGASSTTMGMRKKGLSTYTTPSPCAHGSFSSPSKPSSPSVIPAKASLLSSAGLGLGSGGQIAWPSDWEPEHFSEHRVLTASYCARAEVGIHMDRVVDVLGRREFPGVIVRTRNDNNNNNNGSINAAAAMNWNHVLALNNNGAAPGYSAAIPSYRSSTTNYHTPTTNYPFGHGGFSTTASPLATSITSWGDVPQYSQSFSGEAVRGQAKALLAALEDKKVYEALVFEAAGYVDSLE